MVVTDSLFSFSPLNSQYNSDHLTMLIATNTIRRILLLNSILPVLTTSPKICALTIPGSTRVDGYTVCITYRDVNNAFHEARRKVGLRTPVPRDASDPVLGILGLALQETTRILAERFRLSGDEIHSALPRIDTSLTEVADYCPEFLRSQKQCRPTRYRRHDGGCNNLRHSTWGAARTPFKRLLQPEYADGISELRQGLDGFPLPPARAVSSRVHKDFSKEHDHIVTIMFVAWGQLIDHDLTLTAETKDPITRRDLECCGTGVKHPNCLPAEVPHDDPFYKHYHQRCISILRSLAGARSDCRLGSRVQINSLTSYMDANFVYGSSYRKADSIRELQGGFMKTVDLFKSLGLKPILPPKIEQPDDGCIRPTPNQFCFLAGDNRVNEQLALGVLHTVFVRVHNLYAERLAAINPHWDDETIYQETRHIMAAVVQHITYAEFLPRLLGPTAMERYGLNLKYEGYSNDYDPEVDVSIPASFATAAFRFGHSLLPQSIERRSVNHHIIGERRLSEMLQQPYDLYQPGLTDEYIIGMSDQLAQAMDDSVTEEVTNHLFQEPRQHFGKDLATINIVRAREHGVPSFYKYRQLCGLDLMNDWIDMIPNFRNSTINHYLDLYSHPEDIDLWSAGVAEVPEKGSMVGPTFTCIIAKTFRDLKRGDRFWYENRGWPSSFTPEQLAEIRKIRLSRLLCDGGDNIQTLQLKAMEIPDYEENPRLSCKGTALPSIDLSLWKDYSSRKEPFINEDLDSVVINSEELLQEDNEEFHPVNFGLLNTKDGKPIIVPELDKVIQELVDSNNTKHVFLNSETIKNRPQTSFHKNNKVPYKSWG
ncbi:salivary peroxidase/catechol oxidase-like [Lycorma delicatula]|uniref:salivary peroxidase/catechol oxidase-like n=1 Tax=Lycorma delicatula TaxID=130591 RepID=UPI003F50F486